MPDDDTLSRRITSADLVVVGNVTDVRLAQQGRRGPLSEHNPQWSEAVIHIKAVKKGSLLDQDVTVFFPASFDVVWFMSPKLHVNQESIFILHRKHIPELNVEGYTALDPLDVQPTDQLDRISLLLRGQQF
jgi:hypothetical protein